MVRKICTYKAFRECNELAKKNGCKAFRVLKLYLDNNKDSLIVDLSNGMLRLLNCSDLNNLVINQQIHLTNPSTFLKYYSERQ